MNEREVVAQVAEVVAPEGFRVTKFTAGTDLEKEEQTLTIRMLRETGEAKQGTLPLTAEQQAQAALDAQPSRRRRPTGDGVRTLEDEG